LFSWSLRFGEAKDAQDDRESFHIFLGLLSPWVELNLPFLVTSILMLHLALHILHYTVSEVENGTIIVITQGNVFTIGQIST
jgi:hypothetical protein